MVIAWAGARFAKVRSAAFAMFPVTNALGVLALDESVVIVQIVVAARSAPDTVKVSLASFCPVLPDETVNTDVPQFDVVDVVVV